MAHNFSISAFLVFTRYPLPPMPRAYNKKADRIRGRPALRHVGDIVIWEGNYRSDTLFIGQKHRYLNKNHKNMHNSQKSSGFAKGA
jgi:hypothetical protein